MQPPPPVAPARRLIRFVGDQPNGLETGTCVPEPTRAAAWHGGGPSEALLTNRELIRDFFLHTEGMPRERIAEIAGVGTATLRRWELSGTVQLHRDTRLRLLRHCALGMDRADGAATMDT